MSGSRVGGLDTGEGSWRLQSRATGILCSPGDVFAGGHSTSSRLAISAVSAGTRREPCLLATTLTPVARDLRCYGVLRDQKMVTVDPRNPVCEALPYPAWIAARSIAIPCETIHELVQDDRRRAQPANTSSARKSALANGK